MGGFYYGEKCELRKRPTPRVRDEFTSRLCGVKCEIIPVYWLPKARMGSHCMTRLYLVEVELENSGNAQF